MPNEISQTSKYLLKTAHRHSKRRVKNRHLNGWSFERVFIGILVGVDWSVGSLKSAKNAISNHLNQLIIVLFS